MKTNEEKITFSADEFGAFAVCAVRYVLGRRTYMPHLITTSLEKVLDKLTLKDLKVIERDIKDAPSYGDELIDKPTWMKFLSAVTEEMGRRN